MDFNFRVGKILKLFHEDQYIKTYVGITNVLSTTSAINMILFEWKRFKKVYFFPNSSFRCDSTVSILIFIKSHLFISTQTKGRFFVP